jgi:hypothetical protein
MADTFWPEQVIQHLMRDVDRDKARDHGAAWVWSQVEYRSSAQRAELLTQLYPLSESLIFTWYGDERPQISRAIQYLRDWRAKYDG